MRKYTGVVLQSMLSFTIVLFAHRSNYSFCRKRLLSLVFGAFLLDLLCCHTTLSANQRLTAGTYTAEFDYDVVGTLAAARYDEVDILYKLPDRIGNIYPDRFAKEARYERGGRRKEDKEWTYHFDGEGFLTERISKRESVERYDWIRRKRIIEPLTWSYTWDGAGQLIGVKNNDKVNLRFEYDALGRRTAKINAYGKAEQYTITRFLWDGNVPLHEWVYPLSDRPETIDDSDGRRSYASPEPQTELTTWIFDEGTFVPSAKLIGDRRYSIISDYLGTPIEAYDEEGQRVWTRELDIYGRVRIEQGEVGLVPFLYQGQYLDGETGLAYNRFRYYSPETGAYISQDPIRLEAGLTNLYAYVHDVNAWVDPWGLDTFYQLFNGDTLVYEGITKRPVQERLIEHAYDGKSFTSVRYVDDLENHIAARDMEGSSLHHNQLNESRLNKRRNDGGFYHSYNPNNVKDGRTFISKDDIELKMSQGKTAEVDSKGHIINNTH